MSTKRTTLLRGGEDDDNEDDEREEGPPEMEDDASSIDGDRPSGPDEEDDDEEDDDDEDDDEEEEEQDPEDRETSSGTDVQVKGKRTTFAAVWLKKGGKKPNGEDGRTLRTRPSKSHRYGDGTRSPKSDDSGWDGHPAGEHRDEDPDPFTPSKKAKAYAKKARARASKRQKTPRAFSGRSRDDEEDADAGDEEDAGEDEEDSEESGEDRRADENDDVILVPSDEEQSSEEGQQEENNGEQDGEDDAAQTAAVSPYLDRYQRHGLWRIPLEVFDREFYHHEFLRGVPRKMWYNTSMELLLAMDSRILNAMLTGGIVAAIKQDPDLEEYMDKVFEQSKSQLCTYVFEYVNADGISPTAKQNLEIVEVVQRYVKKDEKDWDLIEEIETWKQTGYKFDRLKMQQGKSRYLSTSSSGNSPSPERTRKIEDMISNMKVTLGKEPQDQPLARPLREAGHANNGSTRPKDHIRHSDTANYALALFDAAGHVVFPNEGFSIRPTVVSLCWEGRQSAVAEALFSCICETYTKDGRGFNYTSGGIQTTSADKGRPAKESAAWADFIADESPFKQNLKHEVGRMADLKRWIEEAEYSEPEEVESDHRDDTKGIVMQELDAMILQMRSMGKLSQQTQSDLEAAAIDALRKELAARQQRLEQRQGMLDVLHEVLRQSDVRTLIVDLDADEEEEEEEEEDDDDL